MCYRLVLKIHTQLILNHALIETKTSVSMVFNQNAKIQGFVSQIRLKFVLYLKFDLQGCLFSEPLLSPHLRKTEREKFLNRTDLS